MFSDILPVCDSRYIAHFLCVHQQEIVQSALAEHPHTRYPTAVIARVTDPPAVGRL